MTALTRTRSTFLNDPQVQSALPIDGKRTEYRDAKEGSRLRLIVFPTGNRAWAIRYRLAGGKPFKYTIGDYPETTLADARVNAGEAMEAVARGEHPKIALAGCAEGAGSVAALVALYRAHWTGRASTGKRVNRELDRIADAWGSRSLLAIDKPTVVAYRDAQVARGPGATRNAMKTVKSFLAWCEERDAHWTSPAASLRSPKDAKRDHVLTDAELVKIWQAADAAPVQYGALVKLLILTAARREEIAGLLHSEVGADAIVLPAHRVKTNTSHAIAITPQIRRVLATCPTTGQHVLTGNGHGVTKGNRVNKAVAVDGVRPWRLHDLRRTAATGMGKLGVPVPIVELVLNHALKGEAGTYNKGRYERECADAWRLWGEHVERLVASATPLRLVA